MAISVRDAALDSRSARARLKARGKPYYRAMDPGLHLGYRKSAAGGKWVVRLYLGDQAYKVETIGVADDWADPDGVAVLDFRQAQAAARARHVELARVAAGLPAIDGPYKVRDCLEDYLSWLEGHRRSAIDARYRTNAFIMPKLGDVECARLTTADLQKWLRDLAAAAPRIRSKKLAGKPRHRDFDKGDADAVRRRRASSNRTFTVIKAALNRAWREGKIPRDEAWRRVQPFRRVNKARVRYLTIAEAKRLINASDEDFRKLARAALATGARYSELAALRAGDFNPDVGTVHIRTSKIDEGRHVVLNDEGKALFRILTAGKAATELILTREDGSSWTKSAQARPIAEACARAKIVPPISFHALRHTWASLSVMAGAPLMVVAKNLGHKDTRMVEMHYGHLAPNFIADAIRAAAPNFGLPRGQKVVAIEGRR